MKFVLENSRYGYAEFEYFESTIRIRQEDGETIYSTPWPERDIKELMLEFEHKPRVRAYCNKVMSNSIWPMSSYRLIGDTIIFHDDPSIQSDGKVSWTKSSGCDRCELVSDLVKISGVQTKRIFFTEPARSSYRGFHVVEAKIKNFELVTYKTRNKRFSQPCATIG